MCILTCHNSTSLPRPPVNFETFSAVPALAFPGAVDQFSRAAPSQVSDPAVVGARVGFSSGAVMTAPSRIAVETGHRMGLQRDEVWGRCNPIRSCLSWEGRGLCRL